MKKHDPFNKGLPPPKVAEPKAKRVPRSWEQEGFAFTGDKHRPRLDTDTGADGGIGGARGWRSRGSGHECRR